MTGEVQIPTIADDGWDDVVHRLRETNAEQLVVVRASVFGSTERLVEYCERQGFDPKVHVYLGSIDRDQIARLPGTLTRLCLLSQGLDAEHAEHIAKLQLLTNLDLTDNSIGDPGAQHIAKLQRLTNLNLYNNSIGETGAEHIAKLQLLTNLDLTNNSIGETGAEHIAKLQLLTNLNLYNNSIGETGAEHIAKLQLLTNLSLYNNSIGETGAEHIAKLQRLTNLSLSYNSIGDTGAEHIAKLQRLTNLNLQSNRIGETGAEHIAKLQRLTNLSLSYNSIGDPGAEHIAKLQRLTSLGLDGNEIRNGGARILANALPRLRHLDLENNPCDVPDEVLESYSADRIREFLRSASREDARAADAFKVLILGQGVVGKTHLRENLILENSNKEPKHFKKVLPRTHDIDIRPMDLQLSTCTLEARLWDFGGQQFLHSSHRFFLSVKRCMYVIALDATRPPDGDENSNQLSYWVRMVGHYGGCGRKDGAPVIIVLTKCDEEDASEEVKATAGANRAAVRALIGSVIKDEADFIDNVGWHPVADTEQNDQTRRRWELHAAAIKALHLRIKNRVSDTPGMETKFGAGYFAFRDWIRDQFRIDEDSISDKARYETIKRFDHERNRAFKQLCETQDISPENKANYLAILHSSGLLHWLGDHEDVKFTPAREHLRRFVFNPHWLKSPAYQLIRAEDRSEGGFLPYPVVYEVLEAPTEARSSEYIYRRLPFGTEDRAAVLDSMLVCQVAHECKRNGILIPDHLKPRTGQRAQLEGDDLLRCRLETQFLPEHVFLHYIADNYEAVQSNAFVWRNELLMPMQVLGAELEVLLATDLSPGGNRNPGIDVTIKGGNEQAQEFAALTVQQDLNKLMEHYGVNKLERLDVDAAAEDWASLVRSYEELTQLGQQQQQEKLQALAKAVPAVEKDDGNWVSFPDLAEKVKGDRKHGIFRDFARDGVKLEDGSFGVDSRSQIWRKERSGSKTNYYFCDSIDDEFIGCVT